MNLTFLKAVVRKVSKARFNAFVKLVGLVLGITTFLIISSLVISEESYDNFWINKDQVYRIGVKKSDNGTLIYQSAKNFYGAAQVLKNEIPEIVASANLRKDIATIYTPENSVQDIRMFYTDSCFFNVFDLSLLTNTPNNLFPDLRGAIISKSLAGKLYGKTSPLNQKFKLNEGWEFYVCGVFDDFPGKSHLDVDLLIFSKSLPYYLKYFNNSTGKLEGGSDQPIADPDPYNQSAWKTPNAYTYIRLDKSADPGLVEKKAAEVLKKYTQHLADKGEVAGFIFQPIQSIYLAPSLEGELAAKGNKFKVLALGIIAIFVLLISWFNYAILSVAEVLKNSINFSIKRSMGANERDLFFEHFAETFIFHLFSGFISTVFVAIILRNGLSTNGLLIQPVSFRMLAITSFLVVVSGAFVSAIIPFSKLIQNKLSASLRGKAVPRLQKQPAQNGMLGFQFMVAIILIICTVTVFRQIDLMVNKDLGFNINQVMVSYSPMTMNLRPDKQNKLETFRNEVLRIPSVVSFTTTAAIPGRDPARYSDKVHLQEQINSRGQFTLLNVGEDYFNFFEIKTLFGNVFTEQNEYDAREIVINQKACSLLDIDNFQDVVGKTIYINESPYRLIGIVDDYHQKSLREEVAPTIFFKSLKWNYEVGFYCVKVSPDNLTATGKQLREIWNRIYPNEPYIFSFLDDEFRALYDSDVAFGRVFSVFAFLAIFMASIGLFASVKFSTELKFKEIGVRKVNGATIGEVIMLLNRSYLKTITYSFLLAVPFSGYAMHQWLQNFAYKTSLSWWIFALSGMLTLIVAVFTVSLQSWKAATQNPVEAIRCE